MTNLITYDDGYTVYPGTYVPLLNDNEVEEFIHQPHKKIHSFPAVNVTELSNSFKVEVAIPGVKRENFFVHADDHILSVCVIVKNKRVKAGNSKQEFQARNFECLDRHITLPENADPEFISAEYRDGILCLYAFKTKKVEDHLHNTIVHNTIVVY